jgi:predicted RNase H-like HicB family nuclease
MRYLIIIEKGKDNYGAYVPDVPGCIAVGDTAQEARKNIAEALEFHLEGLVADGEPIPSPASEAEFVEVSRPAVGAKHQAV